MDDLNTFGTQSKSDNAFTRKARLLQSMYRRNTLKEIECGIGPNRYSIDIETKQPSKYGNMLVDGEKQNKNFFFNETFEYAKLRVAKKLKEETIDEYRLFNNMLSSQPMAFNLFHPLMMIQKKYPEVLNTMIQNTFPKLPINKVDEIKIEFIPTPIGNYTNDKSAMDAAILFSDTTGNKYVIAIEVKYTDSLGTNKASENMLKYTFAKELQQFTNEGLSLIESGCPQIYRNYLLTEKYGKIHSLKDTYSIILAPKDHPSTKSEIASLKTYLKPQYHYKLEKYDLETFVELLKVHCPNEYKVENPVKLTT